MNKCLGFKNQMLTMLKPPENLHSQKSIFLGDLHLDVADMLQVEGVQKSTRG